MPDIWKGFSWLNHKCAETDTTELKEMLDQASERIDLVLKGAEVLKVNSNVTSKLKAANEHLADVTKGLALKDTLCKDAKAVSDIHDAMEVLNTDVIMKDPNKAAKAFDQLFSAVGVICKHLPPMAAQWAVFFESAGTFFEDMAVPLNPEKRQSGREQWKQIEGY